MISINSSVFELEMPLRNQELERRVERRRQVDELVHVPARSWRNLGQIRRFFGSEDARVDHIA